jgi:predicted transcriptional regulator/DNA-binding XRE family transcriptional regulator
MARGRKVLIGDAVRRLRRQKNVAQATLAAELGISPSYLNLIEHNQRPVTVALLLKLAQYFDVPAHAFAADDGAHLLTELREVFGDPLFAGREVDLAELRELVAAAPRAGRAVLDLYGAYRRVRDDVAALREYAEDNSAATPAATARTAAEEVSDFVQGQANYFDAIEAAAEALRAEATERESIDVHVGLPAILARRFGVQVQVVPFDGGEGAMRRLIPDRKLLLLSEVLPRSSRDFQTAQQIALLGYREAIERHLGTVRFHHPDSVALARAALAGYFAGAVLMPYEPFRQAAQTVRHDLDLLGNRFGVGFEQVCHRLTTLQRPGAKGVPLHFVRVDVAGNISKRFSASGIQISRHGACPRWNVYDAFMTPGLIRAQASRMPDGTTYFCIARTVQKPGGGFRHAHSYLAIGLGCRIEYAKAFVYADSIDLENREAAIPIGVSCRICERMDCRQRAFPPVHHRLNVDENVRGFSAYVAPVAADR